MAFNFVNVITWLIASALIPSLVSTTAFDSSFNFAVYVPYFITLLTSVTVGVNSM